MFDLKKTREDAGMTQEQIAEIAGVTRQAIGQYEAKIIKPSVPVAKIIGHVLNFDWTKLYD